MKKSLRLLLVDVAGLTGMEPAEKLRDLVKRAQATLDKRVARPSGPDRRKERRSERNETTAEVRAAVFARSGGRCECGCGRQLWHSWELDHFFGGPKRNESNTVEGCWALTPKCHSDKTENKPNHGEWLWNYRFHCSQHGYVAQVAAVNRALALYQSQHPTKETA